MIKKTVLFFIIVTFLIQCGFQPIYSEKSNVIKTNYIAILTSENSIAVKEAFNSIFRNSMQKSNYQLKINILDEKN